MHRTHFAPWARGRSIAGPLAVAVAALAAPAAYAARPDPAAGWHGRAITDPRPADADVARRPWPRGWSAGAVRLGAGYAAARGSRRVRDVQRRLRSRGYRTGRVDGRFGPRTRAAVTWFQIKHGLRRTGAADRATVAALRARPHPPDSAAPAFGLAAPLEHVGTSNGVPTLAVIALLLAFAAIGFLAGATVARRRAEARREAPAGESDRAAGARGDDAGSEVVGGEVVGGEVARGEDPRRGEDPGRGVGTGRGAEARDPRGESTPAASRWDRGGPEGSESPASRGQLVAVPATEREERPTRVLGYVLTPANQPPARRLQEGTETIAAWCESHGWELGQVVHDVHARERPRANRPGLDFALNQIAETAAVGLVCVRLSDLSDSVADLGTVLQAFVDRDAFLVALDYDIDTSTSHGALASRALLEVGTWERARNESRSGHGLAAVGGRPSVRDHPGLSERIASMRAGGMSLQAIADTLNDEGVPTIRGGSHWRPSSVQAAAGYKRPTARGGA